jgi:eukaryotic-like serine/threonine-protein kinase
LRSDPLGFVVPPAPNPSIHEGTVLHTASGEPVTMGSIFGENRSPFQMDHFFFRWYDATNARGDPVTVKVYDRYPACEHVFRLEQVVAKVVAHPGAVRVTGEGWFEGCPFSVFEYMAGGTLRCWLLTHGSIAGSGVLCVARQVAQALDFAHARGVIHSDVQPANVWLDPDPEGRAALAEFGVTIAEWEVADIEFPQPEGYFRYVAPERFKAGIENASTDIYSFGVTLCELITGITPFERLGLQGLLTQDAADVRTHRKDVPESLALRLAQALSRDPDVRPPTAAAVLAGVEEEIAKLGPAPTVTVLPRAAG